jgi:hypothetical protein
MMTEDLKEEIQQQVLAEVLMGFDTKEEIGATIADLFGDEDIDQDWLQELIDELYAEHQQESSTWKRPTDFERLAAAFNTLIDQRIICLHKAGDTLQDGESDCAELITELKKKGITVKGYCFYHTQDLERAIDPQQRVLPLAFGSVAQQESETVAIGQSIVAALQEQGLDTAWDGSAAQRIEVKHIYWRKTPADIN